MTKTCEIDGQPMNLTRKVEDLRFTEQPWEWLCPSGHMVKAVAGEFPAAPDPRLTRP